MKKTLISLLLTLTLALGIASPALAVSFTDLPEDHWSYEYVEEAVSLGLIKGKGDGSFGPNDQVSWAEFAAMIARLLFPEDAAALPPSDPWYMSTLDLLTARGVSDHVNNYAFMVYYRGFDAPELEMNRMEMAVFIVNALTAAGYDLPSRAQLDTVWFPDMEHMAIYDLDAIKTVYYLGIINGTGDGSFSGYGTMTRAEAAKVLIQMSRLPKPSAPVTPDLSNEPDIPFLPNSPVVQPEEPVQPQPQTPAQPVISEESVTNTLMSMQAQYPEGTPWTNDNTYVWYALPGVIYTGYGCVAFAFLMSDAAFGSLPAREISSVRFEDVRPGDILRVDGDTHSVIVLSKGADSVTVAEGNYNNSVHWGRTLSRSEVERADYMFTRYPE